MDLVESMKAKMLAALEHLKNELKGIRTGRANTSMVEGVMVSVYGTEMRLKELASLTCPDSKTVLITPFDPTNASAIGKAIEKADIGFRPIVDAHSVRISVPQMDANVRKEMIKVCQKKLEEAKVSIRIIRRDANDQARKLKGTGEMPEDVLKKTEKTVQECTDKYCKEADDLALKKEQEISTL